MVLQSGLLDDYQLISYPPNSYPSVTVEDGLAVANTGSQAYLYDATTNTVYSAAYPLSSYLIGKDVASLRKSTNSIDAYSTLFQQLTEFPIPEGINALAVNGYIGLAGNVGLTKYYAYNGFYNNLVPLQPIGMWQSHLVGEKSAIVIRVDRIYAFDPQAPTGLAPEQLQPSNIYLAQNYPNPFNPVTRIRFEIPGTAPVRLSICDVLGRE
nr:hypothetical protein [Gammaproteobacteria bacterium]NIW45093.1 hypothetical protein [Gammaproteobacteria bacterium]NIW97850.1 hypothetical protein [Phycisphaerae bacterium]